MKSVRLISAIVAAAAAMASGNALSESLDAQAQAAKLLSRPHTPAASALYEQADVPSTSAPADAQASAAALLSGRGTSEEAKAAARIASPTATRTHLDAQGHAATLLSGSRIAVRERAQTTAVVELSGEHPAVLVSKNWRVRGIDPNQFIVAHPARLRLLDSSPN